MNTQIISEIYIDIIMSLILKVTLVYDTEVNDSSQLMLNRCLQICLQCAAHCKLNNILARQTLKQRDGFGKVYLCVSCTHRTVEDHETLVKVMMLHGGVTVELSERMFTPVTQ